MRGRVVCRYQVNQVAGRLVRGLAIFDHCQGGLE